MSDSMQFDDLKGKKGTGNGAAPIAPIMEAAGPNDSQITGNFDELHESVSHYM